jgi:hypothetical protein
VWALATTNCTTKAAAAAIRIAVTTNGLALLRYQDVEYVDPAGCGVLGFSGGPALLKDTNGNLTALTTVPTTTTVTGATVTMAYPWGALAATYTVMGSDLEVHTFLTNRSSVAIGGWRANLLQLNDRLRFDASGEHMHWDYKQARFGSGEPYEHWGFADPHVYWWDHGATRIFFVDLDPQWETGVYRRQTGDGDRWVAVAAGGAVPPGGAGHARVALRFRDKAPDDPALVEQARQRVAVLKQQVAAAADKLKETEQDFDLGLVEKTAVQAAHDKVTGLQTNLAATQAEQQSAGVGAWPAALEVAADGYEAFGRAYPLQFQWTDRRPIGTFFVAEAAKGWPTNPNGWFNDPTVDVTTSAGQEAFAKRLLERVDAAIAVLKDVGAQGVIWWDVEGARYPHPITYIGDPRVLDPQHPQHDKYAPELDTPVSVDGQTMPVVDACFAKFRAAGFRVGLTIRPQALTWQDAAPVQAPSKDPNVETLARVEYARNRWGCRLFYVDSVTDWFACWWYSAVTAKYRDVLLLPEWARTRTFVNAAPFSYTKFTGWTQGTPATVKACWPNAFCGLGSVDFTSPAGRDDATRAVRQGDVLLFNCWYASPDSAAVQAIVSAAGPRHTPVATDVTIGLPAAAPATINLRATDEDGGPLRYTILGSPRHGTVDVLDPLAGTAAYRPGPTFTGDDSFTYKATDSQGLDSNRATVTIILRPEGTTGQPELKLKE